MSFRTMKLELAGFAPELTPPQLGLRINRSYQTLIEAHAWSFLNIEGLVKLTAPLRTGTVDVTYNSLSVVGTGTGWTSAVANQYFRSSSNFAFYKISSIVVATQTLTLEATYGEPDATDQGYTIFKHIYTKPTDCKNIRGLRYDYNMPWMTKMSIDTLDPERFSTGQPVYWDNVSDTQYEVWPVPDQNYTLRMWYRKTTADLSAETDTPLISERLILSHAKLEAYQQLAGTEAGAARYLPLWQAAVKDDGPNGFRSLWAMALEEDARKLDLPTTVRVEGWDIPQSNDYWMKHDATDPRRYM